jgi:hypothetical protein
VVFLNCSNSVVFLNKNTTLLEQFKNPKENHRKRQNRYFLMHRFMTGYFHDLVQALQ